MLTHVAQRWRRGRDLYRPAGELLQPRRYEVAPIDSDTIAKSFVLEHHYSGSYPAARFRYGLYRDEMLQGVAVFSHPCNNAVLTNVFATDPLECVELGRFVLLDEVPGNGESWFLGQCFRLLRRETIVGVISFADPVPRTRADGSRVFPGHIGTIYQAHNGVFLGRSTKRTIRLLPDGSVLSERAIQKLLSLDKGWRYVEEKLIAAGAEALDGDVRRWAQHWIGHLTRPLRHAGCYRYAWGLSSAMRRFLPQGLLYPKLSIQQQG